MEKQTVLFIHGMCVNNSYWKEWVAYFENKGYQCLAPSYPMHDGTVAELRKRHPDKALGKLTLEQVLQYYIDLVSKMKSPPILIGHSMGGLLVQLLINRGLGKCAVAMHSAPPAGLISMKLSFLSSNLFVLNPTIFNQPFLMSFRQFQYSNVNGLPLQEQFYLYHKYIIPESINVPRGVFSTGKIDFKKPHAPLLFTAGSKDHIIPASLNKKNCKRYSDQNSVADFKLFKDKVHFVLTQNGWQEVADEVLSWVKKHEN